MDPHYLWVVFADVPAASGLGGGGFAFLFDGDILGVMGENPKNRSKFRWFGGMAHEMGHALGLYHPDDKVRDYGALMHAGYDTYPRAYLTSADKSTLMKSTFFYSNDGTPVTGK